MSREAECSLLAVVYSPLFEGLQRCKDSLVQPGTGPRQQLLQGVIYVGVHAIQAFIASHCIREAPYHSLPAPACLRFWESS